MKKTLKNAILFSTLAFGTLEVTSVISNNVQPIAHADTTQTTNNQSNNNQSDNSQSESIVAKDFTDPGMQQVILASVQNNNPSIKSINEITQSDLDKISTLEYSSGWGMPHIKISSFANIYKLTGLTSIDLDNISLDSQINLSPIKSLTNLKTIKIKNAGVTSEMINNLSGYNNPNLTNISLKGNDITDINFIKSIYITNVQAVDISNNKISAFTPIEGVNWPNLQTLDASNNEISDISPIANVNWPNLQNLYASNNQISDISPIAKVNWPNLQSVDVSNNKISNISVIKNTNWPNIQTIDVSDNEISDINPISNANWPSLTSIIADNNHIINIDSFAKTNWTNLQTISVNNNDISDISSMSGEYKKFPNLSQFNVSYNKISNLSFMYGFNIQGGSVNNQVVVKTLNLAKPQKGQVVSIPVDLVDLKLDDTQIGKPASDPNKQYMLISDLHDTGSFTVIGKNGKPYSEYTEGDDQYSNGIDHISFTYNGDYLPNSISFNFSSGLGIDKNIFTGSYTIALNWQDDSANNNNSGSNTTQSTTSTNNNTNTTIDSHKNNAGKPTVTYGKFIATRGLNLYKKNAFTKQNRIKNFKKASGANRPLFKVLKEVTSSINTPRYYVVQINPKTKKEIKGSRGYITAKTNYVTPLYYSNGVKKVKVLSNTVTAYKKVNLKGATKKYKRGTVLKVKAFKKNGSAYALQLENGKFITANKYFVVKVR